MRDAMDPKQEALAIGRQIARVLDEECVKPPLRFQAWNKIHKILEDAIVDITSTRES